jgi:mannose-6-phosphate isomerase-like protein (cupin superfamily)
MTTVPKTIFCDIDGTLLEHMGDITKNHSSSSRLPNVSETIKQWDRLNYTIILTTGRKESTREITQKQLLEAGIVYHHLIMNLPNGSRVVINDRKPHGVQNTAYAVNLVRNQGLEHVDLSSKYVTIPEKYLIAQVETPWGNEELIECNDKYALKKIVMKKNSSSCLQYHTLKKVSIVICSGRLQVVSGKDTNSLITKVFEEGQSITIEPYDIYKIETLEDTVYFESSSNELWDVVYL